MSLVCLVAVVLAGPACAGRELPMAAVAAMSDAGSQADCHDGMGGRPSNEHGDVASDQAACAAVCAALPLIFSYEARPLRVGQLPLAPRHIFGAGLNLGPIPPPPRT